MSGDDAGLYQPSNERKHRPASLYMRMEATTIQQLALQRGEKVLAESIVVTVADRSHGRSYPRFPAAFPEGDRGVLAALVGVMDHTGWAPLPDRHLEGIQDQLGAQMRGHTCACTAGASVAQPSTRRLQASTTTAKYKKPVQVEMYAMSATQSSFGLATAKSRFTRSGAGRAPACRTVVRVCLRRLTPCNPAACIRRATRLHPTRTPSSRNSAWIRSVP